MAKVVERRKSSGDAVLVGGQPQEFAQHEGLKHIDQRRQTDRHKGDEVEGREIALADARLQAGEECFWRVRCIRHDQSCFRFIQCVCSQVLVRTLDDYRSKKKLLPALK